MRRSEHRPNLNSLKYFDAIVRNDVRMKAAAAEFGVTIPTISESITKLENSLGMELFTRNVRRLVLTDHGQALYRAMSEKTAVDLIRNFELIIEEIRAREFVAVAETSAAESVVNLPPGTGGCDA